MGVLTAIMRIVSVIGIPIGVKLIVAELRTMAKLVRPK